MQIILNTKKFLTTNERTLKLRSSIISSVALRMISTLSNLLMVPLILNNIDSVRYGVWITIFGIVQWISTLDIGLGNGLRNYFAVAIANGNKQQAKSYVSTTYFSLLAILLLIVLLFSVVNHFVDWTRILNISNSFVFEINYVIKWTFILFCTQMLFQLIAVIFAADQKPAYTSLMTCIGNCVSLLAIFLTVQFSSLSLIKLSLILTGIPTLIYITFSLIYFNTLYSEYKPAFNYVNIKDAKKLVGLGSKFFLIQLSMIFLFQSNNIIVSQLFGPGEVTSLSIADKYFGIIMIISTIIMFPFWSAFTDAYAKNDRSWIRKIVKQLNIIFLVLAVAGCIMLLLANFFYYHWIGENIKIPFTISIVMLLKYLILSYNNIYNYFINGVSKLKLQSVIYLLIGVLNIPLSIFLGNLFSVSGTIMANVILLSVLTFFMYVQYNKIINNTATGIWNE